jgi:hypothetical protein
MTGAMESSSTSAGRAKRDVPRRRELFEWALFIGGLALLFAMPHGIAGDGRERFKAIEQLVEYGTFADGRYSMVGPLFSLPLYHLGELVNTPRWWCARFNFFVFSLGLAAIWAILRRHAPAALTRQFLLLLVFGSMFPNNLMGFYGEVFTTMFVGVGLLAVCFGHPFLGWPAVVLGVANTPATLVGLAVVVSLLAIASKRVRYFVPLTVAVAIVMFESWLRRGSPFMSGYEGDRGMETLLPYSGRPGFSYPFFFGLVSILFSFGKSILLFVPGLVIGGFGVLRGLTERLWRTQRMWIAVVVGLVVVYSKWWSWYGGFCWGPRFFLIACLPAALAIAARLHTHETASFRINLATLVVLAWSVWVGASGAVYGNDSLAEICAADDYKSEAFCWYVPELSPLFWPFVARPPLSALEVTLLAYGAVLFAVLSAPLYASLGTEGVRRIRSVAKLVPNLGGWKI